MACDFRDIFIVEALGLAVILTPPALAGNVFTADAIVPGMVTSPLFRKGGP
jgi:hypothetical protein